MKYGLYVPNFGKSSDPRTIAELAQEAEKSGWDGFFLWDHILEWDQRIPVSDSFTVLAAIAAKTKRIRMGTTVTPLPSRPPWVVARQTATLDHLSNGRLILGVGLGGPESTDYERFGQVANNKVLAEKLDEALDIITGLWTGKGFSYNGKHYQVRKKTVFLPPPKQKPRIPIWVAGFWPRKGPFRRAARWEGVIPLRLPARLPHPEDLREIIDYIKIHRTDIRRFDIVNIGWTLGTNRRRDKEKIARYAAAGATWWLESLYTKRDSPSAMRKRIRSGPS